MNKCVQLFLMILVVFAGIVSPALAQEEYPYVRAEDDSLPIAGSRMIDPSNHPVTFNAGGFFDVFADFSIDFSSSPRFSPPPNSKVAFALSGQCATTRIVGGNRVVYSGQCDATLEFTNAGGDENTFDTEMLSLSISGGTLPAGVRIRESPTLASTGKSKTIPLPSTPYKVCYTINNLELSTDGGTTWIPGDAPVTLQMRPITITRIESAGGLGPVSSGISVGDLDGDGRPDLVMTSRAPLPTPPVGGTYFSPLDCDVLYLYGGIDRSVTNAACNVRTTHTFDDGPTQYFDTEMLSLDISGGTLPGGVMVRESPSKASLGRTSIRTVGGGASEVSSFFDVFTELSIDGGLNWTPQDPYTLQFTEDLLPPPSVNAPDNSIPVPGTVLIDLASPPVNYPASGFFDVFTDVMLDFGATTPKKPPLPGASQMQSLTGTATFRLSLDGGQTFQSRTCPVDASTWTSASSVSGDTRTFDTEMLSLSLSGGTLPGGVMIRESPTKASLGKTYIRESPSRPTRIGSFFDVFTEISLDGGVSWSEGSSELHLSVRKMGPIVHVAIGATVASGVIKGEVTGDPDFDLLRITHNTNPPPPLPNDGETLTSYLNQGGVVVVLDGVTGSTSDVTCQIRATGNYSDGESRYFDTEMLSLDASGGTFPGGVMIRESPSKASLGRTSIRMLQGGGFEVSSFFDVFTDLSIDGGHSWTPQLPMSMVYADTSHSPGHVDQDCDDADARYANDLFPPQPARLAHPPKSPPWTFGNGASAGNALLRSTSPSVVLPSLGATLIYGGDDDCDMIVDMGLGQGKTSLFMQGHKEISITHSSDDGPVRTFDTEMLSLNLQGPGGLFSVRIRESPTLASTGQTTVRQVTGGFRIHSFFDVFTEISINGGFTWSPSSSSTRMEYEMDVPAGEYASTDFPPHGEYEMQSECSSVTFENGAVMRTGSFFDIFADAALPPAGGSSTNDATGHSHMQMSLDGGNSWFDVFTEVAMSTHVTATNTTSTGQVFDTEMLSMNLKSKGTTGTIRIRESPTLASVGRVILFGGGGGSSAVSSFFDVFTEVSVDDGQTWSPALSSMRLQLDTVKPGAITGMKWHDANGNGALDGPETGLANWKIILSDTLGNVLDTTLTDGAGTYTFPNLGPGTYRVHEEAQPGWIQTGGSPAYGFYMVPGDTIGGNDFGNFHAPDLTGVKFNDHNGDGVRDPEDEGIPGWRISLFPKNIPTPGIRMSHAAVALSMRLNGLPPGTPVIVGGAGYTVVSKGQPTLKPGLVVSQSYQEQKSSKGALAIEPRTTLKTYFETGDVPTQQEFAELRSSAPVIVSSFPQDVTMRIRPKGWDGTIKYSVEESGGKKFRPAFFDIFIEVEMVPQKFDGPVPPPRILRSSITLEADLDGDGEYEPLAPGALYHHDGPTQLFDEEGQPAGILDSISMTIGEPASQVSPISTVTDSLGNFSFSPMLPGVWNILEEGRPCWDQTTPNPGPIEVLDGTPIPPVAFGNHKRGGTIAVAKYHDINHNQQLDLGEPAMSGVEFILTDMATAQQQSMPTDGNGFAYFTGLPNGDYDLTETVPSGYTISNPKAGHSFFSVGTCDTQSVIWLNAGALTDTMFRTATYEEWATSVDAKNGRKPIKCKPDKVDFKLNLVVPTLATSASIVQLKFSMPTDIKGVWADGKNKSVPYCYDTTKTTVDLKHQLYRFDLTDICSGTAPTPGQMIQFDGLGHKGALIKVTYAWYNTVPGSTALIKGSLPAKPIVVPGDEIKPVLRLPMPNLVNVLEELQEQLVFPIVVGGVVGDTHSVYIKGYSDLLKSLAKAQRGGPYILHDSTHLGDCLDSLNGKRIKKQLKGLPPEKYQHRLFAEALTLKLNILASRYRKFPAGFDTLIYDYHKVQPGPFDGKTVAEILRQVEAFISCKDNPKPGANAQDYFFVLRRINEAFSGPIDTIKWSCLKLEMTGVRKLKDVIYMRADPGSFANYLEAPREGTGMNALPSEYALMQNYPNPFNPTTNIEFELAEASLVTLKIYNTLGQEVSTLLNGVWMEDGAQAIEFDAGNLPSGVYFYRILAQGVGDEEEGIVGQQFVSVKKMILVK